MITRWREDWQQTGTQARRYLLGCIFLGAAGALPWTLLNLYLDRLGYSKTDIG